MIISIIGDGNCLFRSLSYFIFNNQNEYKKLRYLIVKNVVQNWENYKHFIIGNNSFNSTIKSKKDYYTLMSKDKQYGSYTEIVSFCEIFPDYTIIIYIDKISNNFIKIGNGSKKKYLIFKGALDNGHFDVVIRKFKTNEQLLINDNDLKKKSKIMLFFIIFISISFILIIFLKIGKVKKLNN